MKKIIIFTQNLEIGGIQKVVSLLSSYLTNNYTVTIVLGEDDKDVKQSIHSDINIQFIKTLKVDIKEKNIATYLLNYRVKELDKILEKEKPEILLSFAEYNNIIALKTKYKCKIIISVRAVFESMKAKKIHLFNFNDYKNFMQELYPKANGIISVSKYILKEINSLIKTENIPTKVIYNGIKKHNFTTSKKLHPKKYILNVGRLHEQKGQIDLIHAYSKISNKIEEDLLIIGNGSYDTHLENEIDKLKLNNRIFILKNELYPFDYMLNSEIFIFPSYYEGFPNVVLEAMSCDCAIISSRFEGYNEIFDEDINLFNIGDINRLSELLLLFIKQKKLRDKIKQKNKTILTKFKLENTLDEYLNFINYLSKG